MGLAEWAVSPFVARDFYPRQEELEGLTKNQARLVKLKSAKYCIINDFLYWKDLRGILLHCLLEKEAQEKVSEFHHGDCGGHLY